METRSRRGFPVLEKPIFEGKKHAFTLAEVLITLVIIGIIAALTIPNLMQKYTEQETVKKVQKFYSTLSNAYNLAMKDNGTINDWGLTGHNRASSNKIYEKLFKPYFKIAKNCGGDNIGNCIPNTIYKALNNTDWYNYAIYNNYYKLTLEDGSAVIFRGNNDEIRVVIFYDTNGYKGPNQWGKDLFDFVIINDKTIPAGLPSGPYSIQPFSTRCKKTDLGDGCAAWVIYKGNMDYLHKNIQW